MVVARKKSHGPHVSQFPRRSNINAMVTTMMMTGIITMIITIIISDSIRRIIIILVVLRLLLLRVWQRPQVLWSDWDLNLVKESFRTSARRG